MPCVGSETALCLERLVLINDIAELSVVNISRPLPLQNRSTFSADEAELVEHALDLRKETGLPFWDALHLSSFECSISENLLSEAQFHQSTLAKEFQVSAADISEGRLDRLASQPLPEDQMLSFLSEVLTKNGEKKHMVLLDFHIPVSPKNEEVVAKVARKLLDYPSYILESGASYHLIGTELVSKETFLNILYKALLFGPVTDRAYIAHQLIEGRGALRFSKGGHNNMIPRLVRIAGI